MKPGCSQRTELIYPEEMLLFAYNLVEHKARQTRAERVAG